MIKNLKTNKHSFVYEVVQSPEGFMLCRNQAPVQTPRKESFIVPTLPLAEAIAEEWRAQTDKIKPETPLAVQGLASLETQYDKRVKIARDGCQPLSCENYKGPLTQLAATAIDIIPKEWTKITDQLIGYVGSELLCHRAEAPESLVARQQETWQPLLDWCGQRFNVQWRVGSGVMPIAQSPQTSAHLQFAVESCDAFRLAGLRQAVDVSGSLVLGLAFAEGHATADQVFAASELDTSFQIQKWGEDPATAKRREGIGRDLLLCQQWFEFLRKER